MKSKCEHEWRMGLSSSDYYCIYCLAQATTEYIEETEEIVVTIEKVRRVKTIG